MGRRDIGSLGVSVVSVAEVAVAHAMSALLPGGWQAAERRAALSERASRHVSRIDSVFPTA